MNKKAAQPLIFPILLIAFCIVLAASLFLSTQTLRGSSVELTLSSYSIRPSVPLPVDITVTNIDVVPARISVYVVDAVTGDLAHHDGIISYDSEDGKLLLDEFLTTRIVVQPTDENRQYFIQVQGPQGNVLDEKKLFVMAQNE